MTGKRTPAFQQFRARTFRLAPFAKTSQSLDSGSPRALAGKKRRTSKRLRVRSKIRFSDNPARSGRNDGPLGNPRSGRTPQTEGRHSGKEQNPAEKLSAIPGDFHHPSSKHLPINILRNAPSWPYLGIALCVPLRLCASALKIPLAIQGLCVFNAEAQRYAEKSRLKLELLRNDGVGWPTLRFFHSGISVPRHSGRSARFPSRATIPRMRESPLKSGGVALERARGEPESRLPFKSRRRGGGRGRKPPNRKLRHLDETRTPMRRETNARFPKVRNLHIPPRPVREN